MSQSQQKPRRKHGRRDSFHQRQIRFFAVLFGLFVVLFIAGMMYLLSRSPASIH